MAKEVQDNLLPAGVPYIKNIKITKINVPAAEVGGDYYDFFDLRDGKIRIVIADASGKNVPAAIVMTVFKTTLSTMDLSSLTAAEVLTKANNIIEKNITSDRFITAMYVVMDYRNGEVELSSAGHNPAFLVSKDGETKSQNVSGIPLGIMNNYTYSSIKFKMSEGDILWMYTDGVTEARNLDGKEFGEVNLKAFISNYSGDNASEDLLKNLNEFVSNAHQHDDITAVTLEYKPA